MRGGVRLGIAAIGAVSALTAPGTSGRAEAPRYQCPDTLGALKIIRREGGTIVSASNDLQQVNCDYHTEGGSVRLSGRWVVARATPGAVPATIGCVTGLPETFESSQGFGLRSKTHYADAQIIAGGAKDALKELIEETKRRQGHVQNMLNYAINRARSCS